MEKLTIEQKAQRYDEAISMAKKFYTPDSNNINLKATLEIIFSELKEDEDEKIRKWLIALIKSNEYGSISNIGEMPCPKLNVLAWLEKQGKQKQDVNIQINPSEYINDMGGNGCYLKNVIQKPANETNLKIEKGKWYVCISQFCNCIEGRAYKATSDSRIIDDFGTEYDMHNDAYKYFRLWTIQDAKDGDIIYSRHNTESFEWIGIFKSLDKKNKRVFCYGFWHDIAKSFNVCGNEAYVLYDDFSPATKEQRELLFQKMHEVGYEWDAEKKELKKVEQKTAAWSEEDEYLIWAIPLIINTYPNQEMFYGYSKEKLISWLKSLKDRVQPQQEWSEEERQIIKDAASIILNCVNTAESKKEEERLEELADKLQDLRPKNGQNLTEDQFRELVTIFKPEKCILT